MLNLVKSAYIIQALFNNTIDIKFNGTGIEFDLYGSKFETDGKTYSHNYNNYDCTGNVDSDSDLLDYITLKMLYNDGITKDFLDVKKLHFLDFDKLKKLSKKLKTPIDVTYKNILIMTGSANDIADQLLIHKSLVKNTRALNRRNMIDIAIEKGTKTFEESI